jgi:plastocyanin
MSTEQHPIPLNETLFRYQTGQISRRQLVRLLSALGVAGVGVTTLDLGRLARASGPAFSLAIRQEGTPPAGNEPPPAATPMLGEQADGSSVWRVQAGAVDEAEMVEAMSFFPQEITINAGDAVFFDFGPRFHTASFLAGAEPPLLVIPDAAAGTPAAGGPRFVANPAVAFPAGGNSYDGSTYVNSGLPDPSAPPFVVTFPKAGTYEYLCLVHPQMKGSIVVQESGGELPMDQAAYDQLGTEQAEALLEEGRQLVLQHSAAATPAAGADGATHEITAGTGGDNVEVLRFLPAEVSIKAGDTVRWTNRSMHDPHTVTFLGGDAAPELIQVEPQEGGPPSLVLNSTAILAAGGDSFDGTGFVNSGILGHELAEMSADVPRDTTFELTFTAPGEYTYYCVFHAAGPDAEHGMVGTIVVA